MGEGKGQCDPRSRVPILLTPLLHTPPKKLFHLYTFSKMKKSLILLTLIFVAVFFDAHDLIAQPPPPALPSDVTQAPIDGGLGLILFGGCAYALRKLAKSIKN